MTTLSGTVTGVSLSKQGIAINGRWHDYQQADKSLMHKEVVYKLDGNKIIDLTAIKEGAKETKQPADKREQLIIRQSCLKSSAMFLANKGMASGRDCLEVAEAFEKWVLR